jgi:hypothetical protein
MQATSLTAILAALILGLRLRAGLTVKKTVTTGRAGFATAALHDIVFGQHGCGSPRTRRFSEDVLGLPERGKKLVIVRSALTPNRQGAGEL